VDEWKQLESFLVNAVMHAGDCQELRRLADDLIQKSASKPKANSTDTDTETPQPLLCTKKVRKLVLAFVSGTLAFVSYCTAKALSDQSEDRALHCLHSVFKTVASVECVAEAFLFLQDLTASIDIVQYTEQGQCSLHSPEMFQKVFAALVGPHVNSWETFKRRLESGATIDLPKLPKLGVCALLFTKARLNSQRDTPKLDSDGIVRSVTSHAKEAASSLCTDDDATITKAMRRVLMVLRKTELSLMLEINAPCFDALGYGSFLDLVVSENVSESITGVLSQMIATDKIAGDTFTSTAPEHYYEDEHTEVDVAFEDVERTVQESLRQDLQTLSLVEALYSAENYVCEIFGLRAFAQAGHGSFISFIRSSPPIQEVVDNMVVSKTTVAGSSPPSRSLTNVVQTLLGQNATSIEASKLGRLISSISIILETDRGTVQSIVEPLLAQLQTAEPVPVNNHCTSLLAMPLLPAMDLGALDFISTKPLQDVRRRALSAIVNTPALSSVKDNSSWNTVFAPALDDVSLFDFLSGVQLAELSELFPDERSWPCLIVIAADDVVPVARWLEIDQEAVEQLILSDETEKLAEYLLGAITMKGSWTAEVSDNVSYTRTAVRFLKTFEAFFQSWAEQQQFAHDAVPDLIFKILLHLPRVTVCTVYYYLAQLTAEALSITYDESSRLLLRRVSSSNALSVLHSTLGCPTKFSIPVWENLCASTATTSINFCRNIAQSRTSTVDRTQANHDVVPGLPSAIPGEYVDTDVDVDGCQLIVMDIRKSVFGLDGDVSGSKNPLEEVVNRALKRISGELYSKRVHFVLELIQNADDNEYSPNVIPSLQVQLTKDLIVFRNNEDGFTETHMRALCNVGTSTKKGGKGYIGQKGIGFKSVFSVSARPEVHSNGFHVAFDRDNCMILPLWINEVERWPADEDPVRSERWTTTIKLPLDGKSANDYIRLQSSLRITCHANILLFLNKLQRIVLDVPDAGELEPSYDLRKSTLADNWIETSVNSSSETWFVLRRLLRPLEVRDNFRVDVTEIALAVLFDTERTSDLSSDLHEDDGIVRTLRLNSSCVQPVYAYLPVKSYGLRFILQGDFMLSSGRESILEDDLWNSELLSSVPELFVNMFIEISALSRDATPQVPFNVAENVSRVCCK
jgi:hypothetical protein